MSTPRIESVLRIVPRWWRRRWGAAGAELVELASLGADQVERMVQDFGLSASELRLLMESMPDESSLLRRRMAALHLDPDELNRTEPVTFRDLRRGCALCESRDECALDLARESAGEGEQDWRDYCPNAATLNMLAALESCSHIRA